MFDITPDGDKSMYLHIDWVVEWDVGSKPYIVLDSLIVDI